MKELAFPFIKSGWTHELLRREGTVALVRRHKSGTQSHFEVVVVRQRANALVQRGGREIHYDAQETYPRSEDWGTYAFSCRTLPQAEQRFAKLQAKLSAG